MTLPVTDTDTSPDNPIAITARSVLSEFTAFLRQPAVLTPAGPRGDGWRRWAWLTALLVVGLIGVMLPLIGAWQKVFGLPSPNAFDGISKAMLMPVVVLVAPLLEELLFRGWQRGSAAALWLLGCALVAIAGLTLGSTANPLLAAGLVLGALLAALPGWWLLRRRAAPIGWFARIFPWIFYAVALGFALFHLTNYPKVSLLAVPMVLPQLWAALVLGYIRQRIGLLPGILAHMTANGCSMALALIGG